MKKQGKNFFITFDSKHTKTRKELSVLHLTQTIHKLKICKKFFFPGKKKGNNLCISFHSKHTKRRKELSVLHLNQTIQKLKFKKKINLLWEKPGKQSLYCISLKSYIKKKRTPCAAFESKHTKTRKELSVLPLT